MNQSTHTLAQFRRLIGHALPYRRVIILVFLFMGIYGGATALRTFMILPAMESFLGGDTEKGPTAFLGRLMDSVWGRDEPGEAEDEETESPSAPGALTRTQFDQLVRLAVLFAVFSLFIGVAVLGREYFVRYLVNRVITDIRGDLYGNLIELDLKFFNNQRVGELISRVTNDIQATQNFLRSTVSDLVQQPLTIVATVGVAFYISWELTLFSLIAMPVVMLPLIKFGRMVRKQARKSLIKLADVTEAMQQSFTGIKIVKGFVQERLERERFRTANEGYFRKLMRVVRAKATSRAIIEFFWNAATAVMILLGAYLLLHSVWGLTLPVLITFIVLIASMYQPLKTLTKAYNSIQEALAGSTRVFELMDLSPEIRDPDGAGEFERVKEKIAFRDVSFAYGAENVLKNVEIEVKPGEVVALVGESGAGKTTLMDLLARFYDVSEGRIEIDGVDVRRIRRASLLAKTALVTQDPFLFNGTILHNILYGKTGASRETVEEAARAAYIHDFIVKETEKGYETVVGERGVKLSGGQRQRITIARALIRDPEILILDEATGALDAETENQVQMALDNLMKDRTTFVIAHRLSTIQRADRILVLDAGEIVEVGTHGELMERNGVYARLYEQQLRVAGDSATRGDGA
ncbi:MAG: ABC transporter ATP-binding protein [Planctomycetota bacterium]|jgi:subfamily B ATP-binding cassette protein MsbA